MMTKMEEIDLNNVTEDEFIEKVIKAMGEIQKNDNKTLTKDSFIKIFKYTGDFAKLRSKGQKAKAQEERIAHFDSNHDEYMNALKEHVKTEEKAYEESSAIMFEKLCITKENFERSQ